MGALFFRVGSWALAGVGLDRVVREWLRGGSSSSGSGGTSGDAAAVVAGVGKIALLLAGCAAAALAYSVKRKRGGYRR